MLDFMKYELEAQKWLKKRGNRILTRGELKKALFENKKILSKKGFKLNKKQEEFLRKKGFKKWFNLFWGQARDLGDFYIMYKNNFCVVEVKARKIKYFTGIDYQQHQDMQKAGFPIIFLLIKVKNNKMQSIQIKEL